MTAFEREVNGFVCLMKQNTLGRAVSVPAHQ
jgi:hypothetical protein